MEEIDRNTFLDLLKYYLRYEKDIEEDFRREEPLERSGDETDEKAESNNRNDTYSVKSENNRAAFSEDYRPEDSSLFVPGSYLQIFRLPLYRMGENLFGFTEPFSTYNIVVREDLKGETFRRVRNHEAYHWHMKAGEMDTRSATGTHMNEFMPILQRTKYRI